MNLPGSLERARARHERHAWRDALDAWTEADRHASLGPDDLDRFATCAFLLGDEQQARELWTRAHHRFLEAGDADRAARSAFRLGFGLLAAGQPAQASGWLARARRVLDEAGADGVARGYLCIPDAIHAAHGGAFVRAHELFTEALGRGQRFGDPDLVALARQGQGRSLIKMGRIAEGMTLLDEAMVAVTAGELSPTTTGDVYCSVIEACTEILDVRRAQEWTAALSAWCEQQPETVPYRGTCLIRRSEIKQLRGEWESAMQEASLACERLLAPPRAAVSLAYYRRGDLHRLRGELDRADEAYGLASEWGRAPDPGMALLQLARGDASAARERIRRAMAAPGEPAHRMRLLDACVDISLAVGDVAAARTAADSLTVMADELTTRYAHGMAAHGTGAVRLAEGDPGAAFDALRAALEAWRELEAPYEEARTRMRIAHATRRLGDDQRAAREIRMAREILERLGARTDLGRLEEEGAVAIDSASPPLTPREREVLSLVATGRTNRAIADSLGLSEKTVARHVANIFAKLGVASRAAATAYAFRHRLV